MLFACNVPNEHTPTSGRQKFIVFVSVNHPKADFSPVATTALSNDCNP